MKTSFFFVLAYTVFACCGALAVHAQTMNPDSLKTLIRQDAKASSEITADRLNQIAFAYLNNQPDSTLRYLERALTFAEKHNYRKGKAKSLYLKARLFTGQGKYDDAFALLEQSKALYERLGDQPGILETMVQTGNVFKRQTRFDEARKHYEQALQLARKIEDEESVAGLHNNIGITYDYAGDFPKAIEYYTLALRYFEAAGQTDAAAMSLTNIGVVHFYNENFPQAIGNTRKANELHRKANNLASLCQGETNLAEMYAKTDSLDAAKQCLNEAEKWSGIIGDTRQQAVIYGTRGMIAMQENRPAESVSYFEKKRSILEKMAIPGDIASADLELGELYLQQKNYAAALTVLKTGLPNALAVGDKALVNSFQKDLAEASAGLGDHAAAYRYLAEYDGLKDSLFTAEKTRQMQEIETKYETEKKERTIAQQTLKIERQQANLWLTLALLAGALSVGGLLFRQNWQQKTLNQLLEAQNRTLLNANESLTTSLREAENRLLSTEQVQELSVTLSGQDKKVLRLKDIVYLKAEGNAVHIYTADGKRHFDWQLLKNYANLLSPGGLFFQTHRSYLVNYMHIASRRATELTMSNGGVVKIGNTLRMAADQWLDNKLGGGGKVS